MTLVIPARRIKSGAYSTYQGGGGGGDEQPTKKGNPLDDRFRIILTHTTIFKSKKEIGLKRFTRGLDLVFYALSFFSNVLPASFQPEVSIPVLFYF